jgi:hypothetical protein
MSSPNKMKGGSPVDYTYGGDQTHETEAIASAAERRSAPHESELNDQLNNLKKCVQDQKKRMAHAFLRIEAAIQEARQTIPASKLKTFLVAECGLNSSDLNTYLRFDNAAIDRRLVEKHIRATLLQSRGGLPTKRRTRHSSGNAVASSHSASRRSAGQKGGWNPSVKILSGSPSSSSTSTMTAMRIGPGWMNSVPIATV